MPAVERLTDAATHRVVQELAMERPTTLPAIAPPSQASILARLRTLWEAGRSRQHIADLLNAERVPTLSGKGRWQGAPSAACSLNQEEG